MPRPIRVALAVWLSASVFGGLASPVVAGAREDPIVRTRMTGWESRAGGFHIYRSGATARLQVGVWPAFPRETVGLGSSGVVRGRAAPPRPIERDPEPRQPSAVRDAGCPDGVSLPGSGSRSSRRGNIGRRDRAGRTSGPAEGRLSRGWPVRLAGCPPSEHEQQVAQPVQVATDLGVDGSTGPLEGDHRAFGAADRAPGDVECRARRVGAGHDEDPGQGAARPTSSSIRDSRRPVIRPVTRETPAVSLAR